MRFNLTITKLATLFFIITGCSSTKIVKFKTPVDTTNKEISKQEKQVYSIKEMQVYATNNFDAARLNGFEKVNDSAVKAIIRPENTPINNSTYYSFKIWSETPKSIYIQFDYPKGYKHRYVPKIKKEETSWSPIDSSRVFTNGESFSMKLRVSKDTTWVSAQEIVTSKDTENWYKTLINSKPYIRLKSVGKTTLGRNLPVLDIYKGEKKNKPIVVLLTRQHPPEVTGFFAYQEFLKTIIQDNNLTNEFLNKYRVLAFPIVNPDGVDLGHWRHNAGGVDTNRDWSEYHQPEIKQIVKFITQESKKNKGKIVLGLDFHSTYEDVFYTNKIREATTLPTFIDDWFAALEKNIPNYKVNEKAGNSTKPVSKGWFLYGQNAVGITYEIGDATPRDKIKIVGKVTGEEMMKILNKLNIN
ncbi:M14 family metallopeptidase [uncultured Tenacibaculum sp.]|uniref:M14 family metallopeptidase n=1 Tax=uncultured Tenacibaculum sp. TaxID=174713 RepID=UPI00261903D2|nr:M14 family metallopeptidase [uncultured Tenacibaculum sp.]